MPSVQADRRTASLRAARLNQALDALEASLDRLNGDWVDLLDPELPLLDEPQVLQAAQIAARASAELSGALGALRAAARERLAV